MCTAKVVSFFRIAEMSGQRSVFSEWQTSKSTSLFENDEDKLIKKTTISTGNNKLMIMITKSCVVAVNFNNLGVIPATPE
jgi:hypothetical protein